MRWAPFYGLEQGLVFYRPGPVGYHQLLAIELSSLVEGFLRVKKTIFQTTAHPVFFARNYETLRQQLSLFDSFSVYGAALINMYKLFERNEFVLMYPGGVREALHRKVCLNWTSYSTHIHVRQAPDTLIRLQLAGRSIQIVLARSTGICKNGSTVWSYGHTIWLCRRREVAFCAFVQWIIWSNMVYIL